MIRTTCEALIFAAVLMTTTSQERTGKDKDRSFLTRHRQENKTQKTHVIEENNLQFVKSRLCLSWERANSCSFIQPQNKAKFKNTA